MIQNSWLDDDVTQKRYVNKTQNPPTLGIKNAKKLALFGQSRNQNTGFCSYLKSHQNVNNTAGKHWKNPESGVNYEKSETFVEESPKPFYSNLHCEPSDFWPSIKIS